MNALLNFAQPSALLYQVVALAQLWDCTITFINSSLNQIAKRTLTLQPEMHCQLRAISTQPKAPLIKSVPYNILFNFLLKRDYDEKNFFRHFVGRSLQHKG